MPGRPRERLLYIGLAVGHQPEQRQSRRHVVQRDATHEGPDSTARRNIGSVAG